MSTPSSIPMAYFIALFCEAIMHGIYTIIFVGALFLLLRKDRRNRRHNVFIGLTVLMYSISTVHISLMLRQCLVGFFDEHAIEGGLTIFNDFGSPLLIGQTSLEIFNCLISDSIVAWRAWVVWGGGIAILVFPAILILTGAAIGGLLIFSYATASISAAIYDANTARWVEIFGAVTFLANLYAIGVIAFKAWQHEKAMKGLWNGGDKFHRALLVFIESGAIYCLVLVITMVLFAMNNEFGVNVIIDILAHLTGIYPSLILILVSAQMAYSDKMKHDTTMATMQFRNGRGRDPTAEQESSYGLEPLQIDIHLGSSPSDKPYPNALENEPHVIHVE